LEFSDESAEVGETPLDIPDNLDNPVLPDDNLTVEQVERKQFPLVGTILITYGITACVFLTVIYISVGSLA